MQMTLKFILLLCDYGLFHSLCQFFEQPNSWMLLNSFEVYVDKMEIIESDNKKERTLLLFLIPRLLKENRRNLVEIKNKRSRVQTRFGETRSCLHFQQGGQL